MRTIKFLISLGIFIGDYFSRLVLRLLGRKPAATCVVLYYHSIPDDQKRAFAHQMDVVSNSTIPVPVQPVPQLLPGKRYSAITFDDGFENIISNAVPELEKRGIPAAVFLTVKYLGQFAVWWPPGTPERQQNIAPVEKWRQLPADLISIGSHTLTHPYLSSLSEPGARMELFESRAMLQDLFKRKIGILSFPYGDFNADLVDWCRDAGYEHVFTSMPENAFENGNVFISGRVSVEPTDWTLEFRLKLLGAYRWLPHAIFWKHRVRSIMGRPKNPWFGFSETLLKKLTARKKDFV